MEAEKQGFQCVYETRQEKFYFLHEATGLAAAIMGEMLHIGKWVETIYHDDVATCYNRRTTMKEARSELEEVLKYLREQIERKTKKVAP